MTAPERPLTAQVVLLPAGGEATSPITAATLPDHAPDADAASRVAAYFRDAGFEVGDLIGIALPITAPRSRFQATFGTAVEVERDEGGAARHVGTSSGGSQLPLGVLPDGVAAQVRAVTFTAPPDFGPGSFG